MNSPLSRYTLSPRATLLAIAVAAIASAKDVLNDHRGELEKAK